MDFSRHSEISCHGATTRRLFEPGFARAEPPYSIETELTADKDSYRTNGDVVIRLRIQNVGERAVRYRYGGWQSLAEKRPEGTRFSDFNREQQGQIAQDYYDDVLTPNLPPDSPARLAFQPFIDDLQAGAV